MARFEVLIRGNAGCYAEMVPEDLCGTRVRPSMSGMSSDLTAHYHELIEGGVVVDKEKCYEERFDESQHEVISGPMLDVDLPPAHMSTNAYFSDMNYKSEPFKEGSRAIRVSLDVYLERWRKLGARVGKRVGNQIVWEDGLVENIKEG